MRIRFKKGKQREFLERVMIESNCPSLRELSNRMGINYSSLKNYFIESRLLPENIFRDLSSLIGKKKWNTEVLKNNWGSVKGGRKKKKSLSN